MLGKGYIIVRVHVLFWKWDLSQGDDGMSRVEEAVWDCPKRRETMGWGRSCYRVGDLKNARDRDDGGTDGEWRVATTGVTGWLGDDEWLYLEGDASWW